MPAMLREHHAVKPYSPRNDFSLPTFIRVVHAEKHRYAIDGMDRQQPRRHRAPRRVPQRLPAARGINGGPRVPCPAIVELPEQHTPASRPVDAVPLDATGDRACLEHLGEIHPSGEGCLTRIVPLAQWRAGWPELRRERRVVPPFVAAGSALAAGEFLTECGTGLPPGVVAAVGDECSPGAGLRPDIGRKPDATQLITECRKARRALMPRLGAEPRHS